MLRLCTLLLIVTSLKTSVLADEVPDAIDFMRQVRPILSKHCLSCHGPDEAAREARLRLDTPAGAFAEANSGLHAIVPGNGAESELLARLTTDDEELRMPPVSSGKSISPDEVATLRRWIEQGATYEKHWSFQPLQRVDAPTVDNESWPRNEIDRFILSRLEQQTIRPSKEADRTTLIRRLSLDLLGLPPSVDDVARFEADGRPDAYERLVDELLASPHFGERWGRHWLDLARYADSDGYLGDKLRPYAWKYRDWVINAVNNDLPFDQFTIEQLAGDLLPDPTMEQKIATGFHRNSMKNTEAGADRELDRVIRTVDRVATTGTVWLGLTIGCAECHAHKYDPISHAEFYELYAFFDHVEDYDIPAAPAQDYVRHSTALAAWQKQVDTNTASIELLMVELKLTSSNAITTEALLTILQTPKSKRTKAYSKRLSSFYEGLSNEQRTLFDLCEELSTKEPKVPSMKAPTIAAAKEQYETHVHLRGDFRRPGESVQPNTLHVLPPLQPRSTTADRLDLAHWLVNPENPLTSRTAVNHIWKHLFGQGLVTTLDDFGATGDPPSHPRLLDWLATTFQDDGWSRKKLIGRIVTSATYRQASHDRPDLAETDPHNTLLARQSRFRLEAEIIRDVSLATSGLIDRTIGGPSIRPQLTSQIAAVSRNKIWKTSSGTAKYRRGMYIQARRGILYPMLTTFDAPNTTVACARRERSNSPLQSLTLLNDPVFFEFAQHFGRRLCSEPEETPRHWISRGYQIALGRSSSPHELNRAIAFVTEQQRLLSAKDVAELTELTGERLETVSIQEQALRVTMARVLMNLDEFITRE
jgi:hypothetical protein